MLSSQLTFEAAKQCQEAWIFQPVACIVKHRSSQNGQGVNTVDRSKQLRIQLKRCLGKYLSSEEGESWSSRKRWYTRWKGVQSSCVAVNVPRTKDTIRDKSKAANVIRTCKEVLFNRLRIAISGHVRKLKNKQSFSKIRIQAPEKLRAYHWQQSKSNNDNI